MSIDRAQAYQPISDYALIGDCHGAALVASDGAIDWCSLERFDADPAFFRILDAGSGGYLSVAPTDTHTATRAYVTDTNLLQTTLDTQQGSVVLTDFMPVGRKPGSATHDYVDLVAPGCLVRIVEVTRGSVELAVHYRPGLAFGRSVPRLQPGPGCITAERGAVLYHDLPGMAIDGDTARGTVRLHAGQRVRLMLAAKAIQREEPLQRVDEYRAVTTAFWREWIAYCRHSGPHEQAVRRSLLAIKMLIYAPSGAIVAAPTTSLPESVGGSRNWDYRFCWLRDAAFALYALAVSGYGAEARCFSAFLSRACAATAPDLRIMYGIDAETDLQELELDHLHGYRGSRPVRQGNGAYMQRQIDVYGELLDWAVLFDALGGRFSGGSRTMLAALADFVAGHWHEPEEGLWEMRGPLLHHVHGKIMSWVALDRALSLLGANPAWERERDRIAAEVRARGVSKEGHLLQAYDHPGVDAALLLAPMVAFPVDEGVVARTIDAISSELGIEGFLRRYASEDGLDGDEGAFLICSFWHVDALLHVDRYEEAQQLFDRLIGCANDVGLYSEEIEPVSGEFLGNFPQTYTQLALIGSAAHLALYRKGGRDAVSGSHADRARRLVSATLGWRAWAAAVKAMWRIGRVLSSKRSMLPPD